MQRNRQMLGLGHPSSFEYLPKSQIRQVNLETRAQHQKGSPKSQPITMTPLSELLKAVQTKKAAKMLWRRQDGNKQSPIPSIVTWTQTQRQSHRLCIMRSHTLSARRLHPYDVSAFLNPRIPKRCPIMEPLVGYFHPECNSTENYMWSANFFGRSSVSQITYTIVYLLGKILCIRSGAELHGLDIWNSLKLFPSYGSGRFSGKSVFDHVLLYSFPPDCYIPSPIQFENSKRLLTLKERTQKNRTFVVLNHALIETETGFVIKHSIENNHQKCLVCFHALLLQKRSW